MSQYLERLRQGDRWWPAEVVLRLAGAALLGLSYRIVLLLHALVRVRPPHSASPAEFALGAVVYLTLSGGLSLAFAGPALLRQVPIPTRSALFARKQTP